MRQTKCLHSAFSYFLKSINKWYLKSDTYDMVWILLQDLKINEIALTHDLKIKNGTDSAEHP